MSSEKQKLVVIAGPTASGKSALAIESALHFGGELLNADSMQVYRGMDVGTAKTPFEERRGLSHHLLDVVDPDEDFNAAIFRDLSLPILAQIHARGNVSFVVGGTGLYIKALLGGLLYCPGPHPQLRLELQRICEQEGPQALHQQLRLRDPESAKKIHPNDKVRLIRALEIMHSSKNRLSSLIQHHAFKERPFESLKICLHMEREALYQRINERCSRMVEEGLIQEVEGLIKKGYAPHLRPMQSIGYRHAVQFLEGTWDLDTMISQLQVDTRRYAKRQFTWFRADPEMIWLTPDAKGEIINKIQSFLRPI